MGRAEFIDPKYVTMTEDGADIDQPFKPILHCRAVHSHMNHCCFGSRSYFLDPDEKVLYCTDRGLKGGGGGASKKEGYSPVKEGNFYPTEEQQRALEKLENALNHASPALAFQCSEVLFDCESPAIMLRVVDIVAKAFKSGDRVWAWAGVHGHVSRIHCARLLRIAAVRILDTTLQASSGVAVMSEDQKQYSTILETCVKRITSQAKQKREIVLQAELRASWAVISSLKNERDIRDWIKDYGPDIAGLAGLLNPNNPGSGARSAVANLVTLYNLMQKKRDRSLSKQIHLLATLEFAERDITKEDVALVANMISNCKRWVTAVLCSSLVKKWLSNPEQLSSEVYEDCIAVLKDICSFRVFVFRSNWKVRCGGLWNVVALYETTRVNDLKQKMSAIIQERKTLEQDIEVLGPMEFLDSFKSAQVYLETAEVYGTLLEKELRDISNFITTTKSNINTEESEKEGKNYQTIIKKELEKVCDTYKEMSLHNITVLAEIKTLNELMHTLQSMIQAQTRLIKEFQQPYQPIPNKIVNLPKMSLVDECFCGRLEELNILKHKLSDANEPKCIALVGPESMGKSWLALKYAKVHIDQYDVVAYIQADSASSIFISLISLAKDLKCEKCVDKETLEAVKKDLTNRPRSLLIYDNADYTSQSGENEYEAMQEYMSLVFRTQGHIIITSRSREWENIAEPFEVQMFSEKEATDLIHDATDIPFVEARKLAVELDCNPLAVKQAATLLKRKKITILDFQQEFRQKRSRNSTIASTVLDVFFHALTDEAKELMEMMALLNGSFISMNIVKGLKQKMTDVSLISLLSDLRSAEFIDVTSLGVSINRSFQEIAQRLCAEKSVRQTAVSETLTEASEVSANNDECFMLNARPYLDKKELVKREDVGIAKKVADRLEDFELIYEEHLMRQKQVENAEEAQVSPEQLVTTYIDSACRFHRMKKRIDSEQAFRDAEKAAGDNLALKVKVLAAQGKILSKAGGDMRVANDILTRAIALTTGFEKEIEEKDFADLCMSYALVKMDMKDDAIAKAFYLKALEMRRKDSSAEKELVQVLVNLAFFYQTSTLKDLDEAEKLSMEALRLIRQEKDKQIGVIYRNLSIIYGEKSQCESKDSPKKSFFLSKKYEYLMKNLNFRLKFHSSPRFDPELAQIYMSIADVFISKAEWNPAIEELTKALEKLDSSDGMYLKANRRIEAAKFYRDHPEITADRTN